MIPDPTPKLPDRESSEADSGGRPSAARGQRPAAGDAPGHRGEIPKCGTAQPTIFWNAGAATDPP
jgi:hypothetical protein